MLKKIFEIGNRYVENSDWRDIALIKLCLCAIGMLIGVEVTPKYKKIVSLGAMIAFLLTYIPLMSKLFSVANNMLLEKQTAETESGIINE